MSLVECPRCHRHHLTAESVCPFCASTDNKRGRARLTGVVMTALTPVVLAACYGVGPMGYDTGAMDDTYDLDEDGYSPLEGDCDDTNAAINPDVAEVCDDEIDNDCDELIDADDIDDCTSDESGR